MLKLFQIELNNISFVSQTFFICKKYMSYLMRKKFLSVLSWFYFLRRGTKRNHLNILTLESLCKLLFNFFATNLKSFKHCSDKTVAIFELYPKGSQ